MEPFDVVMNVSAGGTKIQFRGVDDTANNPYPGQELPPGYHHVRIVDVNIDEESKDNDRFFVNNCQVCDSKQLSGSVLIAEAVTDQWANHIVAALNDLEKFNSQG